MTDVNPTPSEPEVAPVQDHLISNATYDTLTQLVAVVLPALATLYAALAALWDFPKVQEVVGTMTALAAFLGVFLNISKRSYNNSEAKFDGTAYVTTDPNTGKKKADLVLRNYGNPAEIVNQKQVSFKVKNV